MFVKIGAFSLISLRIRTVGTNAKEINTTEEGRPDTAVEARARSVQCVALGVSSKFFFGGSG